MFEKRRERLPDLKPSARRSFWSLFPFLLVSLGALIGAIWYYLQSQMPTLEGEPSVLSNLGFFLLINLNIVLVLVLGFLVIKNLVKLFLDRKRRILGSRLRSRLVAAFVGLSLVPTVLLLLVAKGIVGTVLQGWFSPQIEASVDGALDIAKFYHQQGQMQLLRNVENLSDNFSTLYPYVMDEQSAEDSDPTQATDDKWRDTLKYLLEKKRSEYGLSALAIVNRKGESIVRVSSADLAEEFVEIPRPNLGRVAESQLGSIVVQPEQSINGEFLRGYAPIGSVAASGLSKGVAQLAVSGAEMSDAVDSEASYPKQFTLVGTVWVRPELNQLLSQVINAYDDYKELRSFRRPLASSYTLTLVGVTLMIVFAAVWVGFYLARSLSVPIQELAQGTEQVAHGNLEYRIPTEGDDELGVLAHSFNIMTEDLKKTTGELVARRRYMETVLASVGVGVISFDRKAAVRTCNVAAAEMLEIPSGEQVLGGELSNAMPEALALKVHEMLEELFTAQQKVISSTIGIEINGRSKHLQVTVTRLVDEQGSTLGAVVLLDDFTELVSAQRMAAWQEVARRIAHEIKNPLTPIQLSAQRMQRRFSSDDAGGSFDVEGRKIIGECTETIVSQVETLRALVNEFSQFARMPKSTPKPVELNTLISETVNIYTEAHPNISFETKLDADVPIMNLDREQMARVLINLIDNAVASVKLSAERTAQTETGEQETAQSSENGYWGKIEITSRFEGDLGFASFAVEDSGLGISDRDKPRLFEPYFSTKKGGTGLGLAIASSIVADHNGYIRVKDNRPRGARFIVELPASEG